MESSDIDPKIILSIIRRRRNLIFMTIAVFLGLSLAYVLAAERIYRSTALVFVESSTSNLLDEMSGDQLQGAVASSRLDSEVEILLSDATALAVVRQGGLVTDPEFGPQLGWLAKLEIALGLEENSIEPGRWLGLRSDAAPTEATLVNDTLQRLKQAVSIRRRGLTYLIEISIDSRDPVRAAEIANIYARTYLARQVEAKTKATLAARDVLRLQIETARGNLASSEAAVENYIESNLARLAEVTGDPEIMAIRRQLESAAEERNAYNTQIAAAEGALRSGDWDIVADSLGDLAIAELAKQRATLAAQLRSAGDSAGSPDLRSELARLDAVLNEQAAARIDGVRSNFTRLRGKESDARESLRTILLQSDLSAEMLADLFNLQQSANIARNQYQTLLSRAQDYDTRANLQIADARIVSEALPAVRPVHPNAGLLLALALVAGSGLGIGLALLREYYIGGVISANQLENILQTNVSATVPAIEPGGGTFPADGIVQAPLSLYAESFRKLRAAIDLHSGHEMAVSETAETEAAGCNVILVCSALPSEGKTEIAVSLARTYAQSGMRTLLVDADLRKPSVASRLEIDQVEKGEGLLEYLTSTDPDNLAEIRTIADPKTDLLVLPAGTRSSIPTDQLFNSRNFFNLLRSARKTFDIVVIDSPPLLPIVDSRYLARHADTMVHVVRYGDTSQGEIRASAELVREPFGGKNGYLGVLNLAEATGVRYNYYRKYHTYFAQEGNN